jgi:hypothetical protein
LMIHLRRGNFCVVHKRVFVFKDRTKENFYANTVRLISKPEIA